MERVTVEQNGERITLEVPDGTTDEEIRGFLEQQTAATQPQQPVFQAPVQPQEYAAAQTAMSGARPAAEAAMGVGRFGVDTAKNIADIGRNMLNWTPEAWKQVVGHPIETAKAYVQNMPAFRNAPGLTTGQMVTGGLGQMAGSAGRALGSVVAGPENLFTAPYTMAAYEQEKIRQNPRAPGLEYNPYAQVQRGEAATQGRAAAANQMRAVANMPFGNVTPQERAMLEEDMRMRQAVRRKAFEKVMGPVAPGSF